MNRLNVVMTLFICSKDEADTSESRFIQLGAAVSQNCTHEMKLVDDIITILAYPQILTYY